MASEKKSNGAKITIECAKSLRQKFKKHCKSLNVSASQRLRDLIQKDIRC
jgi:hypothetical protein